MLSAVFHHFRVRQHINMELNKCDEINCAQIEHLIRQNYQQIGWVSVYMEHTKLCIEVKESLYHRVRGNPAWNDPRARHRQQHPPSLTTAPPVIPGRLTNFRLPELYDPKGSTHRTQPNAEIGGRILLCMRIGW